MKFVPQPFPPSHTRFSFRRGYFDKSGVVPIRFLSPLRRKERNMSISKQFCYLSITFHAECPLNIILINEKNLHIFQNMNIFFLLDKLTGVSKKDVNLVIGKNRSPGLMI